MTEKELKSHLSLMIDQMLLAISANECLIANADGLYNLSLFEIRRLSLLALNKSLSKKTDHHKSGGRIFPSLYINLKTNHWIADIDCNSKEGIIHPKAIHPEDRKDAFENSIIITLAIKSHSKHEEYEFACIIRIGYDYQGYRIDATFLKHDPSEQIANRFQQIFNVYQSDNYFIHRNPKQEDWEWFKKALSEKEPPNYSLQFDEMRAEPEDPQEEHPQKELQSAAD